MTKYRSKLQIIAEILKIARDGAKKTHIMYKANLSYTLLCKYLNEVLECGLIRVDTQDSYVVAPKGMRFLQRFNKYREQREQIRKQVEMMDEEKALLEQMYTNFKADNSAKGKS